jgi:hypothetical protein
MPTVFVQLGRPSNENPGGIAGAGEYTEVNGVVTLTKYTANHSHRNAANDFRTS